MLGGLVPCGGGPPVLLLKARLVVGRDNSCDLRLSLPSISSQHCELTLQDGYWQVRDLGSKNGTRVNDRPCGTQWLLPDDVLTLATHRFIVVYIPPADRPAPRPLGASEGLPSDLLARKRPVAVAPGPTAGRTRTGQLLGELVPCGGGDPIPLRKPTLVVGREGDCDIVLRSGGVSRRHCQLDFVANTWTVRDLGSRHGIRVDGVPCQERVLRPGNVLWIGGVRFRVAYSDAGSADPPTTAHGGVFTQSLLDAAGLANWQPPQLRSPSEPHRNLGDPEDPGSSKGGGCA
jgi:adenylate cyclase